MSFACFFIKIENSDITFKSNETNTEIIIPKMGNITDDHQQFHA